MHPNGDRRLAELEALFQKQKAVEKDADQERRERTEKLRALRLAKEAADKAAG